VELIFGCEDAAEALLDELKQSPPGLHDPDSDRVFWVEEFADLFVLYADFRRQKSECVLLVDRRVAINPYRSNARFSGRGAAASNGVLTAAPSGVWKSGNLALLSRHRRPRGKRRCSAAHNQEELQ
jgi:hypothetical protein